LATEVIVGLFTLAGVALGFAGQWLMEKQRSDRTRRIAVMAVLFEISLLAATLESAAKHRERTRERLRTDAWDRHGPELVTYLPDRFVKALQLLYYQLDELQHWYSKFTQGIEAGAWNQIKAKFLAWVYQVEWVANRIDEHNRQRRRLKIPFVMRRPRREDEAEQFKQFISQAYQQAEERLRAEGVDLDDRGRVVEQA
jgi:hypothetical protein